MYEVSVLVKGIVNSHFWKFQNIQPSAWFLQQTSLFKKNWKSCEYCLLSINQWIISQKHTVWNFQDWKRLYSTWGQDQNKIDRKLRNVYSLATKTLCGNICERTLTGSQGPQIIFSLLFIETYGYLKQQ